MSRQMGKLDLRIGLGRNLADGCVTLSLPGQNLSAKKGPVNSTENAMELRFEPPGPGSWELDPVHFPRPVTRYWTEIHPDALRRGVQDFTRFYGMLIDTLDYQYVNGFAYKTVRPVAEDDVPERFKRVDDVFQRKLWREQLHDWDEKIKPTSFKAHRELQSVDPEKLSSEDLIAHLTRCRDNHAAMISQHMRFTAAALVPTGDFLAHVGDWTGASPADLLGLLRGAAPVSAGGSAELERLIAAMVQDPQAQKLLALENEPDAVLNRLRSLTGEAGAAVSAYLDLIGYRLLDGFDISEPYAFELPDALLRAIRIAVAGKSRQSSDIEERIASVRMRVPERHRAEFDELLKEARLTYRIRDERGVYSDIWASGLMRRAVLAGGQRLAAKKRICEPKHLVDAGFEEMRSLLAGTEGPSSDELAARAEYRASHRAKEAPQSLGPPPPPPPDLARLPPAAARMMRAIDIALGALFASSEAPHKEHTLRGLAASRGVYEGPARRVSSPAEFDRIIQGDVLVTESTTEAFNILLPLLGAIVTDRGGLLSHSAIVAREYGIPGVVGTREATDRIANGVRVRVDGNAGEVTVLG
jgi:phosphohistidine swiveling domain-containing protein